MRKGESGGVGERNMELTLLQFGLFLIVDSLGILSVPVLFFAFVVGRGVTLCALIFIALFSRIALGIAVWCAERLRRFVALKCLARLAKVEARSGDSAAAECARKGARFEYRPARLPIEASKWGRSGSSAKAEFRWC